jgi:ubiquinone/menaquinone biosynthesis C-methylase UbiE
MEVDVTDTAATKTRYNRLAPVYDAMEFLVERQFNPWRRRLWSLRPAGRVLEVGVGTGKNMPYTPEDVKVVGIDLSDCMLAQARQRAREDGVEVELHEMEHLLGEIAPGTGEVDLPDFHLQLVLDSLTLDNVEAADHHLEHYIELVDDAHLAVEARELRKHLEEGELHAVENGVIELLRGEEPDRGH